MLKPFVSASIDDSQLDTWDTNGTRKVGNPQATC